MHLYIHIMYIQVYDTYKDTILCGSIYNYKNIYMCLSCLYMSYLIQLQFTPSFYNYKNIKSNIAHKIHTI